MQSIRGRIIVLFAACLIFGGVLTILHYTNMYSLKRKMVMMENFDNLLNNILELRRFEKNFTYYRDSASVSSWQAYMTEIEGGLGRLEDDVTEVAGPGKFEALTGALGQYKKVMEKDISLGAGTQAAKMVQDIRDKGKRLVDFAQNLIRIKQQNIDRALNRTLMLPVAYFIIFIVVSVIVFQLVNSSIMKPLYLIRNALKHVASETFSPIAYHAKKSNEITKLIDAFNKMVVELESRQEQLLQSRKLASIGTFTSGIAHELNNPLNNISLTAETLQFTFEEIDAVERKDLIEDILIQADRAGRVVKNLLEFSRADKPAMIQLDIKDVLERTIKLVKNQLMIKRIQLMKEIEEHLPPIRGKQQQLENAFVNIIINAIQAMPDGGNLGIGAKPGVNNTIRIDIADTGTGIPQKDMGAIFDPFFTTKEVGKGTGLGLSLVYGIVHAHGGTIEVESRVNQGTTFSIFLPIDIQEGDGP